jgi:hypothetical protein
MLGQPMHYIQRVYITTLIIFLQLGPTCFGPVGSSSGTHSKLEIKQLKATHTAFTIYVLEQEIVD